MWRESLNHTGPSHCSETPQWNPAQSGPPCCVPLRVACFEDSWFGISKFLETRTSGEVAELGQRRDRIFFFFTFLPVPRDEQDLYDNKNYYNILFFFLICSLVGDLTALSEIWQPCERPRRQTRDTPKDPHTWRKSFHWGFDSTAPSIHNVSCSPAEELCTAVEWKTFKMKLMLPCSEDSRILKVVWV